MQMLYNNNTVAALATRTRPKGIAMIVSKKITAAALLGIAVASAAVLAKLRPGAGQMVVATTAAVPADPMRPRGLSDVIAENAKINEYFPSSEGARWW